MKTKREKIIQFDNLAPDRDRWREKNWYYYDDLERFLCELIPVNQRVIEIGCGTGRLLERLQPSFGLGIDFSTEMIARAKASFPSARYGALEFRVGDAEDLEVDECFEYVVLSDVLGELSDVWRAFRELDSITTPNSRIVITYFNPVWEPLLRTGETVGLKMPQDYQNWLNSNDIKNLLNLSGFEVIKEGKRQLLPKYIPLVSTFVNRCLGQLPLLAELGLVSYLVARPHPNETPEYEQRTVSVVVPCRNERGNIKDAVSRIPKMGRHTEILFVDGNSNDGTVDAIESEIQRNADSIDIKLIHQLPPGSTEGAEHGRMLSSGKGDAVRQGFEAATGEVLMILDADLTVPPEELPRFYTALIEGRGEFINGSRLVHPMENNAMRPLNKLANAMFGRLFSWLIGQRIKDTLCGTKVLLKSDYARIAAGRDYFGDFDPFGDFDLLFGAAKQNLKIVEVPVHYRERKFGDIKIERFKHGLLLLRMSWIAIRKLKFR